MRYNATLLAVVLGVALVTVGSASADTGTYTIPEYHVTLVPQTDGTVDITYYQKWKVTGGNIPWITVGTASEYFDIKPGSTKGNVRSIDYANQSGWSGVKMYLDRAYTSGQEFEVGFTIRQQFLFYADPNGYRLDFVPGWYDRSSIGELTIDLDFFDSLDGVAAAPTPQRPTASRITWQQTTLAPGHRFRISVVFPKELFPGSIQLNKQPPGKSKPKEPVAAVAVASVFFVALLVLIFSIRGKGGRGGRGGRYGRGGYIAGSAVHGHTSACACACVACACACACAGGGAAGCDRKLKRTCPLCRDCEKEDCPLRIAPPSNIASGTGRTHNKVVS